MSRTNSNKSLTTNDPNLKIITAVIITIIVISVLTILIHRYIARAHLVELRIDPALSTGDIFPAVLISNNRTNFPDGVIAHVESIATPQYWMKGDLDNGFVNGTIIRYEEYVTTRGETLLNTEGGDQVTINILKYSDEYSAQTAFHEASISSRRRLDLVDLGHGFVYGSQNEETLTLLLHGGRFIIMIVGRPTAVRDVEHRLTDAV